MKNYINLFLLYTILLFNSCIDKNICYTEQYYTVQEQVFSFTQNAFYHFFNPNDYKNDRKEFIDNTAISSNLDLMIIYFQKALELNPYRLDIQHSLGSVYILKKDYKNGFNIFKNILKINPKDFNAAILYSIYSKALGDMKTYEIYLEKAMSINRDKAEHYQEALDRIDNLNKIVFNIVPKKKYRDKEHVILILGAGSFEKRIKRLEKGLEIAKIYPHSKIIVSGAGSFLKDGKAEAFIMKEWLINNNIPADNILIEDRSKDTIGNALFSIDLLLKMNQKFVTIISSATHMRRSLNIFVEIAKKKELNVFFDNLVVFDYPSLAEAMEISENEMVAIYRDFFRASGISLYPGVFQ